MHTNFCRNAGIKETTFEPRLRGGGDNIKIACGLVDWIYLSHNRVNL